MTIFDDAKEMVRKLANEDFRFVSEEGTESEAWFYLSTSIAHDIDMNRQAYRLLTLALQEATDNFASGFMDIDFDSGVEVVSINGLKEKGFDSLPVHVVEQKLDEIQRQMAKGWEPVADGSGDYVRVHQAEDPNFPPPWVRPQDLAMGGWEGYDHLGELASWSQVVKRISDGAWCDYGSTILYGDDKTVDAKQNGHLVKAVAIKQVEEMLGISIAANKGRAV